jgi:hypothetical protein
MKIQEKERQIMLSEELTRTERREQLHALIPADDLENRQLKHWRHLRSSHT